MPVVSLVRRVYAETPPLITSSSEQARSNRSSHRLPGGTIDVEVISGTGTVVSIPVQWQPAIKLDCDQVLGEAIGPPRDVNI